MMTFYFITLYPDQIRAFFNRGILGRAIEQGKLAIECIDLRSFSDPPHHKVDDYPFSNRKGMLLKADVLSRAMNSVGDYPIIMPDPKGAEFNFNDAKVLAQNDSIVFICPSYEGVDQRIFDMAKIQPFRIADAIVPTGDSPAVFMAEAIARYLPDMLGCSDCVENDSILSGLLEAPQYTSPREYGGHMVPDVLLSGNHGVIDDWKMRQSLAQTLFLRPDLINGFNFQENLVTMLDQIVLEEYK